jgi:NAD(P)-dependent dehydrogenase (short-subunit alcohol dehydrogenase family)
MEAPGTKRAFVIGASGVFGALIVGAFEAAGWQVRAGARHPEAGQVTAIDLDRPDSVASALRDDELVVNTVPHLDLLAERHVLEHGGTLINVAALPAAASRSLRAVSGRARGTVLMNAGLAPGVTTLVAADLLRLHPDATALEIVFTASATVPRGPASLEFIRRGLVVLPRHRTALVPLPRPFGERRCLGFGEDDAGWLGGIAEGRVVRQYICIAEAAVHERLLELNTAGAMNRLLRSELAVWSSSRDRGASDEPVAHWIAAIRAGRRLGARTVQCRGDSVHAARCAVLFADVLRARDGHGGCFDPEEICNVIGVESRLRREGISIVTHEDQASRR